MKLTFLINFNLIVSAAASQYADDPLNGMSLLQTRIGVESLQELAEGRKVDSAAQSSQGAAREGKKVKADSNVVDVAVHHAVKNNRMVTADLLKLSRSSHDAHLYGMGRSLNSTYDEAAEETCCSGSLVCSYVGCKLSNALVDFGHLRYFTQPNLWEGIGEFRQNSIQVSSEKACTDYLNCYAHLGDKWMRPLLDSATYEFLIESERDPEVIQSGTAFLVIRDNNNIFHQMGSVIAAWEALRYFSVEEADQIVFCDGEESSSTAPLWSPVMGKSATPLANLDGRVHFRDVIVPRNVRTHWWWNVWDEDHTDHSVSLQTLRSRLVQKLPDTDITQQDLITFIERDRCRRTSNLPELIGALRKSFPKYTVESKDFGSLPWMSQLQQTLASKVLMSNHGAGLVWGIYLPKGSIVMELLGIGQSNKYFANEASWRGDIKYLKWQNQGSQLEERMPATDNDFDNNINVDCDEVVETLKPWLA